MRHLLDTRSYYCNRALCGAIVPAAYVRERITSDPKQCTCERCLAIHRRRQP